MCGIGGILRLDGQPIPDEWLDAIDARVAYRGPDGAGRFRDRVVVDDADAPGGRRTVEVAFVHRRLSIIDHAGGMQPMVSDRGRNEAEGLVAVVFNGCIYNHRELRRELEKSGHSFVTDHSDTEVLIHGWREWGPELCSHLQGMFAFGLWDRAVATLFLARDVFGEKPLYVRSTEYAESGVKAPVTPVIAFASESGGIRSLPSTGKVCGDSCRTQWLIPLLTYGYGSGFMPGPDLVEVETLPPNSSRRFTGSEDHRDHGATSLDSVSDAAAKRDFNHLLDRAVGKMLDADVALGCFLSGGVDSSLIAHFARQHRPDLLTFSVRMPDPRYDESAHAEAVARHLQTRHHTLDVAINPAEDLVHLIDLLGQPFGDSSILPTYWVARAARQHVKVALSGDGGDELFMGYERYVAAPFLARHWRWLRMLPATPLLRLHLKSKWHKFGRLITMARDYRHIGLLAMEAMFSDQDFKRLSPTIVDPRWKCSMPCDTSIRHGMAIYGARRSNNTLEDLREFDLHFYLPDDLLRKVDTASMAAGLEVRCPFLDRDLATAALATPIDQLMPGGQRKGLLRNLARTHLPAEIVDRPKMGFAIPIGEWFRNDYGGMKTLLLDHLTSAEPFGPVELNRAAVQRLVDEHMAGQRDHGQRLFMLLTLSIWARQQAKTDVR